MSELNLEIHQGRRQLFEIFVSYEQYSHDAWFGSVPARVMEVFDAYQQDVPLDIGFIQYYEGDSILVHFGYSADYFERSEADQIQRCFVTVLESAVRNPETSVDTISLLQADERRLLEEWNATAAYYPQDKCVHELFEVQARRTPDAVAVMFEGIELSYGELNARANQLAHHLIGFGVERTSGWRSARSAVSRW